MISPRLLAVVLPCAALLVARGAAAAPDRAQELFDRGVEALDAGRFESACPSIEESYKLDPRPGTLFTLAECEAKRGRVATAVRRYDDYLALYAALPADRRLKQGDRDKRAREQRATLLPIVPELTLVLLPTAPRGTLVMCDGAVVAEAQLGVGMRLDPGEHEITTQAPGASPRKARVTLEKGEKKGLPLDVREAEAPPPVPAPVVVAPPLPESGPSGRRVGAFVAGGVGVAGIVVGAITGGLALGKKSAVEQGCGHVVPGDPTACTHDGKAAADSLQALGLVSTIGFGVGLAGVVTGVVLLVTEPKAKEAASARWMRAGVLAAGPDGVVMGVRGVW